MKATVRPSGDQKGRRSCPPNVNRVNGPWSSCLIQMFSAVPEPMPTARRRPSGESAVELNSPCHAVSICVIAPLRLTRTMALSVEPPAPCAYTSVPDGDQDNKAYPPLGETCTPSSTGVDGPVTSNRPRSKGATRATPSRRTYKRCPLGRYQAWATSLNSSFSCPVRKSTTWTLMVTQLDPHS